MSNETLPAGPTPAAELADIASRYPARDTHGSVIGWHVFRVGVNSGREAGPFATEREANEARAALRKRSLDAFTIVCGHVFTTRGTIVRDPLPSRHVTA